MTARPDRYASRAFLAIQKNVEERRCRPGEENAVENLQRHMRLLRQSLEQDIAYAQDRNRALGLEMGPWDRFRQLVIKNGVEGFGRCDIDRDPRLKVWRRRNRPRIKQCFFNSQLYILEGGEATYHEGFCCRPVDTGWPFHHAWLVLPDGRLVDFTLDALDRLNHREGREAESRESVTYLGLPASAEVIRQGLSTNGDIRPLAEFHNRWRRPA
jgi:hypothetical protein